MWIMGLGIVMAIMATSVLLCFDKIFVIFNTVFVVVAAVLHNPCLYSEAIDKNLQVCTLTLLFALICGMVSLPSTVIAAPVKRVKGKKQFLTFHAYLNLSLIHISEPTRPLYISYAVFCLKKKKKKKHNTSRNPRRNESRKLNLQEMSRQVMAH
eukprot:TRINITY_DN25234_c0_g1_i5.p1 TRINITY_DN25234_c0_g1~~TRINITY_DN25234_c0_g1_i5.p1  ORF type:complete len:180 (-),score=19.23 TRINITY_DN25234_c0_g1_i5:40-501(-)